MIRVDTVTDLKPLDNLTQFVTRYPQYAARIVRAEVAEAPTLLGELQAYPPVPQGSKYKRTFKLRDGYKTQVFIRGTEVLVEVKNTSDRKRHLYVKGRRQTIRHRQNGWRKDDEIIRTWLPRFRLRLTEALTTGARSLTNIR